MGLTRKRTGDRAVLSGSAPHRKADFVVALAGNPNVGKSTVFNALTGLDQHTGNWPGKTVSTARGWCRHAGRHMQLVDLPGTYSLSAHSPEEAVARDFLQSGEPDAVAVVCDASCLERGLVLVLQVLALTGRVVVCVNLLDEAEKRGIKTDLALLQEQLGVPVVGTIAQKERGLDELLDQILAICEDKWGTQSILVPPPSEKGTRELVRLASTICEGVQTRKTGWGDGRDRRLDRILTSRRTGFPVMLALLALVFWLTMAGANAPSALLSRLLFALQDQLSALFVLLGAPDWLHGLLVLGLYRVLAWVVSVMLPPMAIFFPLFTLLEDAGYLPRVAYNLDRPFRCCGACGKQALTMCMGFGCNAAGVTGCRIIDSERERLLAILTNSLVPCNGRFPLMGAILTMFFVGTAGGLFRSLLGAGLMTAMILLGVAATFGMTKLLSATVLRGTLSSFTLELPPYRRPLLGRVLVRSVLDRTLFVLGRAAAVAAPAGAVIWLLANLSPGGVSLLTRCAGFLDPFARLMGLDGVLLLAFVLGFPANEIVLPIAIMAYTMNGSLTELGSLAEIRVLLLQNGWTATTAVSMLLFSLLHWPCSTTLLTIYRETKSRKWTALGFFLPTAAGMIACMLFTLAVRLF